MYVFRLQPVLDHKQFVEDNLKKELAEIKQQVLQVLQQLDSLKRNEMTTVNALKQEQEQGLSSDQVVAYHDYLKRISEHITRQQVAIDELQQLESNKQGAVIEAMKKRQVLEKLKQQGLDRFNQAILKKEMDFIDEIAVNQFAREAINGNGGGE